MTPSLAPKIPVTIITGSLGAGKTTLINQLLATLANKHVVIIENEFGQLSIDHALIAQEDASLLEINNGCICCDVRSKLVDTLLRLSQQPERIDHLIIETTGLAHPGPVALPLQADPQLLQSFELRSIIAMVDALHLPRHLNELRAATQEQLALADTIIINKLDLIDEDALAALEQRLLQLNSLARYLHRTQALPLELDLLEHNAFDLKQHQSVPSTPKLDASSRISLKPHVHDQQIRAFSIERDGQVNPDAFNLWLMMMLKLNSARIFRSKGVLSIPEHPRQLIFQSVHAQLQLTQGRLWGDDEARQNRLVFIGRGLDLRQLQEGFAGCVLSG